MVSEIPDFKTNYKTVIIKEHDSGRKQTHTAIEQNREIKNKHIHLQPTDFYTKNMHGSKDSLSVKGIEKRIFT
jgi:hypothetical protein